MNTILLAHAANVPHVHPSDLLLAVLVVLVASAVFTGVKRHKR